MSTTPYVSTRRSSLVLLILAYAAFISLGLPDGLVGVGWPSIRQSFELPVDALGALLLTVTTGYLTGSFISGRLMTLIGVGNLLALSGATTATALIGYTLAPGWWVMVALGVLAGLGGGAIDAGINTYAATYFSERVVNWLHASFGIGATLGPAIMTAVLASGTNWRAGFWIVGSVQIVLATCFFLTRNRWQRPTTSTDDGTPHATFLSTLGRPITWLNILFFLVYTGLEFSVGQWTYSVLTDGRGIAPTTAGAWVSLYWASLTLGRIGFGVIVGSAPLKVLLRWGMLLLVLGAVLLGFELGPIANAAGVVLMGLAFAPIFPSMIATTPARMGADHAANAVGMQIAGAGLGGALIPGLFGILAGSFGFGVYGAFLLAFVAVLIVLFEAITSHDTRRAEQQA